VDEESVDVLRHFTEQKMRLMPYLQMAAEEAYSQGIPLMRPMFLEFPEDPGCAPLDRQYMLGPDLLVAPVMNPGGEVSFYLPEGVWTHLQTGETLSGPRWHHKKYTVMEAAVWVREAAIIPIGTVSNRPDYQWAEDMEFHAFEAPDGLERRVSIPSPDGGSKDFQVRVQDGKVTATAR
jgi:alpha-D-xyloside xylohydrolase